MIMGRTTSIKVQAYLSSDDPLDAEIAHFLNKFAGGRRTSAAVRELLYVAWLELGSMSREVFEGRFKAIDYDEFHKRYPTSRGRKAAVSPKPGVSQPDSAGGEQTPAVRKRIRITPPKAV